MAPLLALLPLLGAAWAAPCPAPATPTQVLATTQRARAAFAGMDGGAFQAALATLGAQVPCLGELAPPPVAAQVHLVYALAGFLARDESRTIGAFQAAQAADPNLQLEGWLPDQHPIHLEWRLAARLDQAAPTNLDPADGEDVVADGLLVDTLVESRPALLQRRAGATVADTLLWQPGSALPAWAPPAAPSLSPAVQRRLWLGSATVASAAATTALLLVAGDAQDRYSDPDTPYADLAGLEKQATNLSIAGIATGTAALGLSIGLAASW